MSSWETATATHRERDREREFDSGGVSELRQCVSSTASASTCRHITQDSSDFIEGDEQMTVVCNITP